MKIHLLGDSIVQSVSKEGRGFYSGWGDYLSLFFKEQVEVRNYARGGRSSRSFLNEGRFLDMGLFTVNDPPYGMGPAYPCIEAGDYVFLQFMHNDDDSENASYRVNKQVTLGTPDERGTYPTILPEESMRVSTDYWIPGYPECLYAEGKTKEQVEVILETAKGLLDECGGSYYPYNCGATYKGYLKFYVDRIREKGAYPVLITAPVRWCFEGEKIVPRPGHHGGRDAYHAYPYVEAMRQLGQECGVPVLDLFEETKELYERLGSEASSYLHNLVVDNTGPSYRTCDSWCQEYDKRRKNKDFQSLDKVHSNRFGACLQAALLVKLIKRQKFLDAYLLENPSGFEMIPVRLNREIIERFIGRSV